MHFIDNRPVYKSRDVPETFDNTLYYYSRFNGNCPICISYHESPCIIPCGHTFCADCLERLSAFTRSCPVCAAFYWASRPVRFFLAREISGEVLFVRLDSNDVAKNSTRGFFEYPYGCHYYESEGTQEAPGRPAAVTLLSPGPCAKEPAASTTFYQSVDGQLYFLHPKITRQRRLLPEFIYGTVKTIRSCKSSECSHPELRHVPPHFQIHIVVINE